MFAAAKSMFGEDLKEHLRRGGRRAPAGSAVGWALIGLLGTAGIVFVVVFAFEFVRAMV